MLFYMWHAGFGDVSSQRGRDFNGEAYYVTPVQYTGRCIMWQNYSGAAESVLYVGLFDSSNNGVCEGKRHVA